MAARRASAPGLDLFAPPKPKPIPRPPEPPPVRLEEPPAPVEPPPPPAAPEPPPAPPPRVWGPLPESPVERAWEIVARECPEGHSAAEHRFGAAPRVHVVPMGHEGDVRCLVGEPVPGYTGFYRPAGGHRPLVPSSAHVPTEDERRRGLRNPDAIPSRKSWAYLAAEWAGRGECHT